MRQISNDERKAFDNEVERVSGMECDETAKTLSVVEFRRVADEALKNIKKRKQGKGNELVAYA
jgi:hypothetical protein